MQMPLQIVFRDLGHSDAIEQAIRERADRLDRFYDRIMGCRVTAGMIQKHKHQGKLFNIRIDITVPGSEIIVNRDKSEDIYVAIRDAFDHAKRKLEDFAQRQRREVKHHEQEAQGRVTKLFPEEGFGFIEKADGSEIYFHRYSLANTDFDTLTLEDEVSFLEEVVSEGMQANRVVVRRH